MDDRHVGCLLDTDDYDADQIEQQAAFVKRYAHILKGVPCTGWPHDLPTEPPSVQFARDWLQYMFRPYNGDREHLVCVVAGLKPMAQVRPVESGEGLEMALHGTEWRGKYLPPDTEFLEMWYRAQFMCGMCVVNDELGGGIWYRPEHWPRAYLYLAIAWPERVPVPISLPKTAVNYHSYALGYTKWSTLLQEHRQVDRPFRDAIEKSLRRAGLWDEDENNAGVIREWVDALPDDVVMQWYSDLRDRIVSDDTVAAALKQWDDEVRMLDDVMEDISHNECLRLFMRGFRGWTRNAWPPSRTK